MRQFILPNEFSGDDTLTLTGESFHYLCRVLRKKEGDTFPGLDRQGNHWNIVISKIEEDSCRLNVSPDKTSRRKLTEITLVQCLPKGKKMDLVIRQAVESGVSRIIPVESDHAVPRFENDKDRNKKRERWEKIALEAMQQSGSEIVPEICKPVKMERLFDYTGIKSLGLFCHQERIDHNSLHQYLNETPDEVFIVIGPEGGLSDREVEILFERDFKPVYLGDNILRTETAALFATAAVKVLLLENEKWSLKD
ncbi:RsmE family RNA methyltransferase [Spirochaeta isovalerica]|uniref:Ribosomal RNA small subunit methyltransferase E n=1 Tax=Spirochaeta isovalerica TaxID=150 RepID=A0A841RIJ5_9SPIO|nr:RsmE family RNA methyltransferase [Spirochaeta isovalerica]MBB6482348.1 16S rRNA (uracil1498-N3)-methyltransferase [Spirochaeta isovalerica]